MPRVTFLLAMMCVVALAYLTSVGCFRAAPSDTDRLAGRPSEEVGVRLVITDKALSSTSSPIISLNIDIDGTVRDSLAHKITDEDLRGIIDATLKAKGRLHLKAVSGRVTLDVLLGFIRRVESLDKSSSTFPIFLHLK